MSISRHFYLTMLGLAAFGLTSAQTILTEDFETGNKGENPTQVTKGAGWTVSGDYKGTNEKYRWHNEYRAPREDGTPTGMQGTNNAAVDCPISITGTDGAGPREEYLISPEINIDDTYELSFMFYMSPMNSQENTRYDLQVRVIENNDINNAETIFSTSNEKMLRESGVMVYPITTWDKYSPRVSLEDFKGQKIKLAFVYKMYQEGANSLYLDDIKVSKFTPASGPIPQLSLTRNNFGDVYVGEKRYSELITLTNVGKDGLKITGIDCPEGISCTLDWQNIELLKYQHVDFNLAYTAKTISTPASGVVTIHTTGGDVKIDYTAKKNAVPEGCYLETFEESWPPAGWKNNGWNAVSNAFEGDRSVNCSGGFGKCTLRSPRLDLFDGGKLTFTYFNYFDDESAMYPEYDVTVEVSYDGGNTWKTVWTAPYQEENALNHLNTVTVDLGKGGEDCYVQWVYPMVETDDEGALPHSSFTLDSVILPNLYGADGTPLAATIISPANGATDVHNKNIKLEWAPAQFATGYKLYLGTNREANDVINGKDLGKTYSYVVDRLENDTDYRWKIVGYNDKGESTVASTWRFTTQPDASVTSYPYVQNFESSDLPLGWVSTPSNDSYERTWSKNEIHNYTSPKGTYGVFMTTWLEAGSTNSIGTQEFNLPADKNMAITFIWGDEHPADLLVDESGMVKKNNVLPNNGISFNEFQINVDGEWTTLSTLSEDYLDEEHKYWITETISLAPYKGKKVEFRWVHHSYSGRDSGAALTHVVIDEIAGDLASFNRPSWNAGKVNYEKAINSGEIFTIINGGSNDLKIKNVSFETPNFETSLSSDETIKSGEGKQFDITFKALQSATTINDKMTVEFESGYSVTFPVSGIAVANGEWYYSFEPNPLDHQWDEDWTMIDVDKGVNFHFSSYWVYYSADSQRGAFSAESDSKEKGMYGMMKPVSGMYALVASAPQTGNADNWIISKGVKATANAKFDFYARNWETINSVLPGAKHHVTVLVSTKGDSNTKDFNTKDFEVVMKDTEMDFLNEGEWHHYEVDLSKYDGKNIHIALRHTTNGESNLAFFDDFTIKGVDNWDPDSIREIATDLSDNAEVEVYNFSGVKVAEGNVSILESLDRGFYVVKATDGNTVKSYRIVR